MPKEIELWNFIARRLRRGERVVLLVVAESSGSSPGRAGYKMAVGADGELCGSIGGGLMEVSLVEQAKAALSEQSAATRDSKSQLIKQEHRRNSANPSGMICSGEQTVISVLLQSFDLRSVQRLLAYKRNARPRYLKITGTQFSLPVRRKHHFQFSFERGDSGFVYEEFLSSQKQLIIIGGGHCALALSELMSRMDFHISIFDDRPKLNTIDKNDFADEIMIIDGYDKIADHVGTGDNTYVVVITLGYASDEVVIRSLFDCDFKYFGVLGSKAKMATLMRTLRDEGYDTERLNRIRTPIGIPINSRTPEEIAVSIAAEIISVKNAD